MDKKYDFSGWATVNDLECSDGRTIRDGAFKDNDGKVVPLVWNHDHNDPNNVLGHALLEYVPKRGMRAYATFNSSENGAVAKELVDHGDVVSLSIWANKLKQIGGNVMHGDIKEVSLVLSGANPGAYIDTVSIAHSEGAEDEEEAVIYTGEGIELSHSDAEDAKESEPKEEKKEMAEEKKEKTVKDVFDTLTEEQKTVVYALIGQALEDARSGNDDEGEKEMKHNVFDNENENQQDVLSHSEQTAIISDLKRYGSLRDSVIAHTDDETTVTYPYGIENMDYLMPEYRNLNTPPEFIKRDTGWVAKVMAGVHHTPFSRIKSMFANITEDEARAKGNLVAHMKKEEVFSLLKRTTDPQTVYKKQKFDRDDLIDITDFDVVAWVKSEMRMMLDEELARAYLIGDGRLSSDDDKIQENHIRPIYNDADLFTVKVPVVVDATNDDADAVAKKFLRACIKARKYYKGSGNPTLFTTEDMLSDMLLLEDGIGHLLYPTESALATTLRVKEIVTVPQMENLTFNNGEVFGIIVNLADYNVGADKGGAINMFDDFDIDYNQQKYLIETRCSGALIKPYSAMTIYATEAESEGNGE